MGPSSFGIFAPNRWFSRRKDRPPSTGGYFRRDSPVPGLYHYIPGRGNYLVVRDDDPTNPLNPPVPVVYSSILNRYLFQEDFASRKVFGNYEKTVISDKPSRNSSIGNLPAQAAGTMTPAAPPRKKVCSAFFFRLDDGTFLKAYDGDGLFLNPTMQDRYKVAYPADGEEPPRFKRIRPVTRPGSVRRGASTLMDVPEIARMATTRPPSPRSSWDAPVLGGSVPEPSAPTMPILSRPHSLPDMTAVTACPVQAGDSGVCCEPVVKDSVLSTPLPSSMAMSGLTVAFKGDQPGVAVATAVATTVVATAAPVRHQSTGSTAGAITPASSKGLRTPSKKAMMMANMGELRRRLEALTAPKRPDVPTRPASQTVSPVSS